MFEQILTLLLIVIFTLGSTGIVLLQLNIILNSYRRQKQKKKRSTGNSALSMKVIERVEMSDRHFSVRLQTVNGRVLDNFLPGQYLTLLTQPDTGQGSTHKRCYSLAAWQQKPHFYELGIVREVDGQVSSWLHRHLQPGTVIDVLPPKGNFVFNPQQSQHSVLVAGGIGITPLRAMLHQYLSQQAIAKTANSVAPIKTMSLFYAAKSLDEMCYIDEFVKLADQHPDFYFYPILSQAKPAHAKQNWQGLTGRLNAELLTQNIPADIESPARCHYYLCGPQSMMDSVKLGLVQQKIPLENIHFERFGISSTSTTDKEFSVKLDSKLNGKKIIVFQQQRSLLDALEQQGVNIESECRSGECGECKVKLHRGKIKQLIETDIDLEVGEILPCCCVPESDLLIGL